MICLKKLILIKPMNCVNVILLLLLSFSLDKGFSQDCNDCHNLMQKAISFNVLAVVSVKRNDCRIHFWYVSRAEAMKEINN